MPATNIDTDQIIPARFLTSTSKAGFGKHLFADWRYDAAGNPKPEFPLNRPEAAGARILVSGRNIGCGSSREHAPWALQDFGFEAVISTEFADIFRTNCLKNGLLPVVVDEQSHAWLFANPGAELTIDVQSSTLTLPDGTLGDISRSKDSRATACSMASTSSATCCRRMPLSRRYEQAHR